MKRIIEKIKSIILNQRLRSFWRKYQLPKIALGDKEIPFKQYYPDILDEICIPPYKGEGNLKDFSILFSIIDFLKPDLILEFGTAHGNTVANICSKFPSRIITVNALPEQIEGRVLTYTLTEDEIGYVYRKFGFSNRVEQIYANTRVINLKNNLDDQKINLGIIDACHDSEFVLNDFLKIQPFMSPNSIVLFHDTHPSLNRHYIDSYIGCMYLRKLGFHICYIEESSWGIWFAERTNENNPLLKKIIFTINSFLERIIFGTNEEDIKRIRYHFRRFVEREKLFDKHK